MSKFRNLLACLSLLLLALPSSVAAQFNITGEVITSANNAQDVEITTTLHNGLYAPGTLVITDQSAHTITADVDGVLTGDIGAGGTNTIDATGFVSFSFSGPSNGPVLADYSYMPNSLIVGQTPFVFGEPTPGILQLGNPHLLFDTNSNTLTTFALEIGDGGINFANGITITEDVGGSLTTAIDSALSGTFTIKDSTGPRSIFTFDSVNGNIAGDKIVPAASLTDTLDLGIPTTNQFRSGYFSKSLNVASTTVAVPVEQIKAGDTLANVAITGTLAHLPKAATITITDTTHTITDGGENDLVGDIGSGGTNTINYRTGAYSFSFSGASTGPVNIAYQYTDGRGNFGDGITVGSTPFTFREMESSAEHVGLQLGSPKLNWIPALTNGADPGLFIGTNDPKTTFAAVGGTLNVLAPSNGAGMTIVTEPWVFETHDGVSPVNVIVGGGIQSGAYFKNQDTSGNSDLIQLNFSSAESPSVRAWGTFEFQNSGEANGNAWFGMNFDPNFGNTDLFKFNSTGVAEIPAIQSANILTIKGGTTTVSSCGTGSPSVVGNDNGGVITTGTSTTGCVLNFSTTLSAAPVCNFNTNLAAVGVGITSISTSAATLAVTSTPAATIYYQCRIYP